MMEQVELPKFDKHFVDLLLSISETIATDKDSIRRRLHSCIEIGIKDIVQQDYYYLTKHQTYLDTLFAPYFSEPLIYYLAVFKNITGNPSCVVRHKDVIRTCGINYYVDLGGDNVITSFYNPNKTDYHAQKDTWYLFNASKEHEVSNITSTRVIFGMDLESQPTYEEVRRLLL